MTTVSDPDDNENARLDISRGWHAVSGDVFISTTSLRKSPQPRNWFAIWSVGALGCLLLGTMCLLVADIAAKNAKPTSGGHVEVLKRSDLITLQVSIGAVAAASLGFGIPWLLARRKYMKNQNKEFEERIKAEKAYYRQNLENLKKATELATLMQLNQGQIKTYHDIVTDQADKSFKSSRVAMGLGMFLLAAAAVGGAFVPIEQVRWFIGALAAFSTLLSGYLSRTYLSLYRDSIGQLNRYFDQPVLNSYYLTAERLMEGLDKSQQVEMRVQVIREVLSNGARMGEKVEEK